MKLNKEVAVIGAGIAGLTAGFMLKRRGFSVSVFEAGESVRGIGAGMALASNAMKALEYLGLVEEVRSICHPLNGFEIWDPDGRPIIDVDTKSIEKNYQTGNFSVHRADLHAFLLDKIQEDQVYTEKTLIDLKRESNHIHLKFSDKTEEQFDFVIGADGVNSKVRQSFLPQSKPQYAGYWCWRGVVETSSKEKFNNMEIWGEHGRFGYTSMIKNRGYWFACINTDLNDDIKNFRLEHLKKQFQSYHSSVSKLLDLSQDEKLINGAILDIKPLKNFYYDNVLLIGDAAHATTPNMGQGACMAIEDVAVLEDELKKNNNDLGGAAKKFERRRLDRTKYITKNSKLAGRIAQLENKNLIAIRNILFRNLPSQITQFPLKRLNQENFLKA